MPASDELKDEVVQHVARATSCIPSVRPADLPPTRLIPEVSAWHGFEHELWRLGEEVRHVITRKTTLRRDQDLYSRFLEIAQNRAAMRGRQSWVLLFAYKPCRAWAPDIAALLPDSDIEGHVISALYKMRAPGFSEQVLPFRESRIAWISTEAKRYLEFDQSSESLDPGG